jgi:AcrR family transcriptional regulator
MAKGVTAPPDAKPWDLPPRDRIMTAASLLFAQRGINRAGVDALIATADVAKRTFYRHFQSKDDLIVAWLGDPRTRWFDRVLALAEARATEPGDVVVQVFGAAAEWLDGDDYRGCPYLKTSVEIADPDSAAGVAVRDTLAEIGAYLERSVAAAGYAEPARLGRELHTLLAGAISLGVANRTSQYALAARDAARDLLATADRQG